MSTGKYIIGCMILSFAITSCEKKDSYDIKGEPGVKFFTRNEAPGNAPPNSISYNVVNYPDVAGNGYLNLSSTLPAAIKFPVFATAAVSKDVVIEAMLDNSVIADFNTANHTDYLPLPAGILNVDAGLNAKIPKGQTRSVDSITILPNPAMLKSLNEKRYLVPIRLARVSDATVGSITSGESQITFIVINVELRWIKYLAVAADAIGSLLTPRTSWAALFNPVPATTGNIFDGSLTTFSRWTASPGQLDVNMQTIKNVTGIRLYTANTATNTPTQIDVYLSTDGINYDLIGSPLRANLTYASSYNYILFYKPIAAQYIRLVLYYGTSTNTQNFRVVEFDVYGN